MLTNYIKLAIRNIKNAAFVSSINIASLAIATAAVIGILLWIEREISFDRYHKDSKKIYLLKNYERTDNQTWVDENAPYPIAKAINEQIPGISKVAQMRRSQENEIVLKVNNNLYQQNRVYYIDSNWLHMFDYKFVQGNPAYFFSHPYSLLLTESKAAQIFGSVNIIGQTVQIDTVPYRIGGIIKDNPDNSSFQFDVMIPMAAILDTKDRLAEANYWPYSTCRTFVRIDRKEDLASCESSINKIYAANSKKDNVRFELLPLSAMHFSDDFDYSAFKHANRRSVVIFFVLGLILLIIACINYVNLSIAVLINRLKEISIRKISGAKPVQLFFQIITESSVTALIALILAILLLALGIPVLRSLSGINLNLSFGSLQLWATLLSILVFVIMAAGIYPALLLNTIKPTGFFKGINVLNVKNSSFKKVLLTIQFSLAVFMIIATIVVRDQLAFIQRSHSHLDAKTLFTVQLPDNLARMDSASRNSLLQYVKTDLMKNSAIRSICRTDEQSLVNYAGQTSGGVNWNDKPENFQPTYVSFAVESNIKDMLNLTVLKGRWFAENPAFDKKNIILNETAVKEFNLKEPVLGKRFNDGVIIGVIKDFMFQSMHVKISPVVMRIGRPLITNLLIEANSEKTQQAVNIVNNAWNKYFPGQICNVVFVKDELKDLYLEDNRAFDFTKLLSFLAILLCCAGLFGMTIFMIHNRKKEIGIRKLLGASVSGILMLISKEFILLVLIAILISSPIAWLAMHKWLENYAYRIDIGVLTFLIAGLLSLMITMVTISIVVLRSATGTQVNNLRSE